MAALTLLSASFWLLTCDKDNETMWNIVVLCFNQENIHIGNWRQQQV